MSCEAYVSSCCVTCPRVDIHPKQRTKEDGTVGTGGTVFALLNVVMFILLSVTWQELTVDSTKDEQEQSKLNSGICMLKGSARNVLLA